MMMGCSKLNDDINITERKHLKQNIQDKFVCDKKNGKIPPTGPVDRRDAINTGENCPNNSGYSVFNGAGNLYVTNVISFGQI